MMKDFKLINENSLKEALIAYYKDDSIFEKVKIDDFKVSNTQKALFDFKEGLLKLSDKRVLIVGDFDCDGILSTTILKAILRHLNIQHNHYIPSREKEGYGLNKDIVKRAKEAQFDAIITIDNGIVALDAIAYAKELDLLLYIMDHHEYETLPEKADYILHPNLLEADYQKSCATGLAYLLSTCFFDSALMLIYAAIATCGDQMEVFGYNRYLIKEGLKALNANYYPTISAISGKKKHDYDDFHFQIVPKINAFSRLNLDREVNNLVHFFLLENEEEILNKTSVIQQINDMRKARSEKMHQEAIQMIQEEDFIILLHPSFQEGLSGLLASRISNEYGRPCLIFAYNETLDIYKGSGRGVEGFDLYRYLKDSDLSFTHFGGHKMAVGLSLKSSEFDALKTYVSNHPPIIEPIEKVYITLKEEDLNATILNLLQELKPFGTGLKEPLFYIEKPKLQSTFMIKQKYPKYTLNNEFEAICFKNSCLLKEVEYFIGSVHRNQYRKNGVSFQIEDCK